MSQYFRIKKDDRGKAFIVDHDGNKLPPEMHRELADSIIETVDQSLYVYMGRNHDTGFYKIGVSNDPDRRAKELGIEIYAEIECAPWGECSAFELEKRLHNIFTEMGQHITGEWFELDVYDVFFFCLILQAKRSVKTIFSICDNIARQQDSFFENVILDRGID